MWMSQERRRKYLNDQRVTVTYTQQELTFKHSLISAQIQPKPNPQNQPTDTVIPQPKTLNYELIKHFDMFGGDIRTVLTPDREQSIKKAIELIGEDSTKCASICLYQSVYYVYLKSVIKCLPGEMTNHSISETVFYRQASESSYEKIEQSFNIQNDS